MIHLAANGSKVASLFHQVHENGIARVGHLIEPFNAVVVRIAAGPKDISRGHAVADLHVGPLKAHAFLRQLVHIGRRARQLAAESPNRIGAQVIDGDDEQIEAVGRGK